VALLQEQVIGPLSEDQREVANILGHNTRALQRQIEDLLNYHATVFDAAHLVRRRVDLHELPAVGGRYAAASAAGACLACEHQCPAPAGLS
jgi:hypothetical protein